MTIEELMAQMIQGGAASSIAARLSAEARAKLIELATRQALLQCEMAEIGMAEAARLARDAEEEQAIAVEIGQWYAGLICAEGVRLAPENIPVNQNSM